MPAKRPSERRHVQELKMDLDLTPMMNMIAILIPVLLASIAFVKVVTIDVELPGQRAVAGESDPIPVNVRLTITDAGYLLSGAPELVSAEAPAVLIPPVEREVSCMSYVGTVPPPRAKNAGRAHCTDPEVSRNYWVYDTDALRSQLERVKEKHPESRSLTIAALDHTHFEALSQAMDASREYEDSLGRRRALFDNVRFAISR